jgi:hypothetical protein
MSEWMVGRQQQWRVLVALTVVLASTLQSRAGGGPIDMPNSSEPRVAVARSLSEPGLLASEGNFQPFFRVRKGDTLYSRDLIVAIPGFKVEIEPASKAVGLTLWGNLPGLSDSPVRESAVILHDSRAYDLDVTLVRGRIVLSNKKASGSARVWVRADTTGVEFDLPEPGDSVALEIYGRWAAGVGFSLNSKEEPVRLWEIYCLKGKVTIKAAKNSFNLTEPPGLAYFHGDSIDGPAPGGPEKRDRLPDWANPKAPPSKMAPQIRDLVERFKSRLQDKEPDEVAAELLREAEKDTNKERANTIRQIVVFSLAALDEFEKVATILENSPYPEQRQAAVLALRHWIGARQGRDEKLYETLQAELGHNKAEAETILQLLHSPFNPQQPETFETLITYLQHRKQIVRELAHWHLVRLAPAGRNIPFDAGADAASRAKGVEAWKKLIPPGELPPEKPSDSKK